MRRGSRLTKLLIGIASLLAFLFTSCESVQRDPVTTPDDVSFSTDVQKIFNTSCASSGCHGGGVSPDLRENVSYTDLFDGNYIDTLSPDNSFLYQKIDIGGSMSDKLNSTQRAIILKWIQQGAKDN